MSVEQSHGAAGPPARQEMEISVVLRAAGRQWVAGCRWVTPTERAKDARQIATEAEAIAANAVAVRKPARMQALGQQPKHHVGYYRLPAKTSGALYSIGAALAERQPQGWTATYSLPDGRFLYVVVLPGNAIDPTEHGEVVGNRQDVESARSAQWMVKELDHEEGSFEDLEAILRGSKDPVRISAVRPPRERKRLAPIVIGTALVCAGAGYGFHRYRAHEAAVAAEQAAAAAQAQEARQALLRDPLVASMSTQALFARCGPAVNAVPLSTTAGAQLVGVQCTPSELTTIWEQIDGEKTRGVERLPTYVPAFIRFGRPPVVPRVPPVQVQLSALKMMAAHGGFVVSTNAVSALPGSVSASSGTNPQQRVEIVFDYSPWSTPLWAIPGLRVLSVNFNESKWIVDAVIYGN